MNKIYVTPAIAVSKATTKYSTMIIISGRVDNPDDSDSKLRKDFEKNDNNSTTTDWGTIW